MVALEEDEENDDAGGKKFRKRFQEFHLTGTPENTLPAFDQRYAGSLGTDTLSDHAWRVLKSRSRDARQWNNDEDRNECHTH